jgi:hypothetical protein
MRGLLEVLVSCADVGSVSSCWKLAKVNLGQWYVLGI